MPLEPAQMTLGGLPSGGSGFVGQEVMAGDMAECAISLEMANDQFDTSTVVVEAPRLSGCEGRLEVRAPFLNGPIPHDSLTVAASQPGKALQVAIGLLFLKA
jgi:hypothetical protein